MNSLTDEQIKQALEAGVSRQQIERFVSTGSARPRSELLQEANYDDYGATFPAAPDDSATKAGLKALGNVPSSATNLGKTLFSAVTNPIDTATNFGNAVLGGFNKGAKALTGHYIRNDAAGQKANATAEEVGRAFLERYGSLDNAQRTATNDPVGVGADILSIISGGRSVATMGTKAGAVAQKTSQVSKAANSVNTASKGFLNKRAVAVMDRNLNINPSDSRRIQLPSYANKSAGEWLLERRITGSRENVIQQLQQLSTQSRRSVDTQLNSVSQRYNYHPVKDAINELETTFKGTVGNDDILNQLKTLRAQENYTLSDINNVKRMLDRELTIFKTTGDVRGGAQARGLANIRDDLKTFIEDRATENGVATIKQLNKETQVATEIRKAILKRDAALANNRAISLTDLIVGTGIGVGFDPVTAAGVVISKKLLESPRFQSALARNLSGLPDKRLKVIENAYATRSLSNEAIQSIKEIIDQTVNQIAPYIGPVDDLTVNEEIPVTN